MRILICGSRDFSDWEIIHEILDGYKTSDLVVIHGACNTELDTRRNKILGQGADAIAHDWCIKNNVKYQAWPANWEKHGKRAGFLRNTEMLEKGKPDIVIGFMNEPASNGTSMMLNIAKKAGIPTYRIQCW
jgi:hypothetical protein